jgi:hypothetical protein
MPDVRSPRHPDDDELNPQEPVEVPPDVPAPPPPTPDE